MGIKVWEEEAKRRGPSAEQGKPTERGALCGNAERLGHDALAV